MGVFDVGLSLAPGCRYGAGARDVLFFGQKYLLRAKCRLSSGQRVSNCSVRRDT